MSHSVLKTSAPDPRGMFSHLLDSVEMTWQRVTRNISINPRHGADEFRIADPGPMAKPAVATRGIGYVYKKTGSISKR